MFRRENDPRLLGLIAIIFVVGALASALGLAHFTVASGIAGLRRSSAVEIVTVVGIFGWYFALMYGFSGPGRNRVVQIAGTGLVLGFLACVVLIGGRNPQFKQPWVIFGVFGCALGYPALLKMAYDRYAGRASGEYRRKLNAMLFVSAGIVLLAFTPQPFLDLSASIHPNTYDTMLYHFESTLGFQASPVLAGWIEPFPWIASLLEVAYIVLPTTFAILLGAQLAAPDRPSVNLLAVWVASTAIAMIGFHLLPVAGPKYLFESLHSFMPAVDQVPLVPTQLPPVPRNGVPSLHFGWGLLLWLNAMLLGNRWLRGFFFVLMGMNFLATMALGEHYLIDLIVVIPMIVAVQAMAMNAVPWSNPLRKRAAFGGIVLWLAWVLALRFGVPVFEAIPGLAWVCVLLTIATSVWLYRPLVRAFVHDWRPPAESDMAPAVGGTKHVSTAAVRVVALMFVLSGFSGLMYEVVFSKSLALAFGSTATAMYTVLATYMGGMAIGAWLGGRLAARRDNPLMLYAFCELGIGIYCVATALVFTGIQDAYVHFAAGVTPDAPILALFRVALGVAALMVPTILMGMTLPILARFFEQRSFALGRSVAVLYACNTIGAAFGALLAGYFIIPLLGITGSTRFAVLLSLLVALLAIQLQRRTAAAVPGTSTDDQPASGDGGRPTNALQDAATRRLAFMALAILGIGGVVTLATETIYIHLLAVVAGNSTYAFSLMLFTFLLGLGAGAEIARRLLRGNHALSMLLASLEFALAAVLLGGVFLWDEMPAYFGSFAGYPLTRDFAAREVVRGIICWLAMFPPAACIGAIYPVAMECIGQANPGRAISSLGTAAALNTLGNIVGVLLGGFVFLPIFGPLRTVQLLAAACIVMGAATLACVPSARRWSAWSPAAIAIALMGIQPASFNYDSLASGANVYFQAQNLGKIIDHAESIDGGLTSVAEYSPPGQSTLHTLLTNGKFQGNDAMQGEMKAQVGFSLAPLLHTDRRTSALVIGYGTGVSARVLHEAGFQQVDVVDLSADIIRIANRHFSHVNASVATQPGVQIYITDGRNFLLLQDRKYDLVGIEISSIWFAGAASLYNREFYHLVRQRLNPDGVLQQWVQLHHMAREDVLRVLGSVRAEFRYAWLYLIGGQGIIVATNDPSTASKPGNIDALRRTATLQEILGIFNRDPSVLLESRLLDPAGTDRLLADFAVPASHWISNDDNLFLEYDTPKGNVLTSDQSFNDNVRFIKEHSRE